MTSVRRPPAHLTALVTGALLVALLPGPALAAPPTAADDAFTVGVDSSGTSLDVLLNDTDPDGDALTISGATDPAHGSVTNDGTALTYTPDPAYRGIDTFAYTIGDAAFGSSTATVTMTVNDPPIAVDDPGTICGPSGPPGSAPFGGAYPVPEDYVGDFPPIDYHLHICGLLLNDSDPNGDPLTWHIYTPPTHGDVLKFDETFFGYRPDPNYSTKPGDQPGGEWISDSFTYRAFDGLSYSQPATMRYWVAPINDAPTFTPGDDVLVGEDSGPYSGTWATNVSPGAAYESDQTVQFEVTTDLNGVPDLFTVLPAIDANGVLTFTPATGEVGLVHVTVRAKDDGGTLPDYSQGTATPKPDDTSDDVTFDIVVWSDSIAAVDDDEQLPEDPDSFPWPTPLPNPWPVDVLANDTYPLGSTITSVTQGSLGDVTIAPDGLSVLYAPDADAYGTDTFTYTLDDGAGTSETATVRLTIDPVNDPPVAVDDSQTVLHNAPATGIAVLANDHDVDDQVLVIVGTTDGSKGSVMITGGGTGLTYQPDRGATGADSFTYTITDGHGTTATATVWLQVVKVKGPKG